MNTEKLTKTSNRVKQIKKKLLFYALVPVLGLGLFGASIASAHGLFWSGASAEEISTRQQAMFESQAKILGISVDQYKTYWSEGKNLREIASELGISDEQLQTNMKNAANERMKSHMQALVDKGVITQAQADSRLKFMETRVESGKKGGFRHHGFWF